MTCVLRSWIYLTGKEIMPKAKTKQNEIPRLERVLLLRCV